MLRQSPAWPTEFYGVVVDDSPRFRFLDKSPPDQTVREALSRHLRPRARVLDIGCGAGIGACHLAAAGVKGVTYVRIDRDARARRKARWAVRLRVP